MDRQAGSDSGLRPPQGQSRFWESIFLLLLSYDPACSNFHFCYIRTTGKTQSMRETRYRAKAGPEVVLVAPCAFFILTVVRTTG